MDSRTFAYPIIEMEPTVPSWWLPRNLVVCGGVSLHLLLRRATSINLKVVIYAVVCALCSVLAPVLYNNKRKEQF